MTVEVQKEHRWLQKFTGEWTFEAESTMKPGDAPMKTTGHEVVRSLGGLWIVAEGEGEMPGGGIGRTLMTLGYDPQRKRFTGTWIGSMMTHMWVYDGGLDAAERVLTLDAEGPAMSGQGMGKYKDVFEFKSDDHRVLTSHSLGEDGKWTHFMTAHYRRKA